MVGFSRLVSVFCTIFTSFTVLSLATTSVAGSSDLCNSSDSGPVKPTTPLISFLERLQSAALGSFGPVNFDPKLYVDLPLKHDLLSTEDAFKNLFRSVNGSVSRQKLEMFLDKYLGNAGSDLVPVEPTDYAPEPAGFLPKVENPEVRAWALEVHSLWRNLSRRVSGEVKKRRERHTLLPVPGPTIVPGSRFKETYYWDSYWIIRGLLVSKMYNTAKSIVYNLISLIDAYGHVLNCARTYCTNRSAMVFDIYRRTGDLELVRRSLPSLLKEHHFWNSGIHEVTITDAQGVRHTLSRYYAMWNKARPESATIDKETASSIHDASEKKYVFRQIASTAESGWDFSTRWMRNSSDLATLATTSIIPVDLNAYILKMETVISFFARIVGENSTAVKFSRASHSRQAAMHSIFWNPKKSQWLDYWLKANSTCKEAHKWKSCNQNKNIFASNFIPLWIDFFHSDNTLIEEVVQSFQSSGLLHAAGIATSLSNSGQQWDFPNGWAPLQHLIVEGLAKSGSRKARLLAEAIAVRWIRTNYAAYKKTGVMHEKYDVEGCGKIGGGGEYVTQTGFGWSNGVVLAFLEEFGWPRDREIACQK
ncbi:probable trehalase isoform X2 [Aristolochia californica]|uniref:probable trehalase isoform X2 n=1 Tax=Aristolochia californica TaxID=171875 RepID=UPI0035DC475C